MPPLAISAPLGRFGGGVGARRSHSTPAFGDWADIYRRFRPHYPDSVFQLLTSLTQGQRRLCVELGAGSGQATACLLETFDQVLAVEPDPSMAALMAQSPRLEVRVATAEAFTGPSQPADAVVAASAFHWMDQTLIAARSADWLRPGGVFFAFSYGAMQRPAAAPGVQRVLQRHAKFSRAHVDSRLADFAPYQRALETTQRFSDIQTFEVYVDHCWTPRELAGFLASTSYGQAAAVSTGDAAGYFARLLADLDVACDGRRIPVRFPIEGAFGLRR